MFVFLARELFFFIFFFFVTPKARGTVGFSYHCLFLIALSLFISFPMLLPPNFPIQLLLDMLLLSVNCIIVMYIEANQIAVENYVLWGKGCLRVQNCLSNDQVKGIYSHINSLVENLNLHQVIH